MDCSPPGFSVHGIFQAGVLEWGAIAFSTELEHMLVIHLSAQEHVEAMVQSKYKICISLSHFGEGNGTPLQYSCLENPMDGGAW